MKSTAMISFLSSHSHQPKQIDYETAYCTVLLRTVSIHISDYISFIKLLDAFIV